jgi:hypothetical protein
MSNLYGRKKVKILKQRYNKKDQLELEFSGDVTIIDKIMVSSSEYYQLAVMNDASFEVYVGVADELNENGESIIVLFQPTDIKRIY